MLHVVWLLAVLPFSATMEVNSSRVLLQNTLEDLQKAVESGIQLAMYHCQQQFKWHRWNCPQSAFSRRDEQLVNRETAFVQGITASGVVHSITTACSTGDLQCGCARYHRQDTDAQDFEWGRCSDNVKLGIQMADSYLDVQDKKSYIHNYIKMHNNFVGQQAVRHCMELNCKCFGLSGSCTTRVCWKRLCPFHKIAMDLHYRYARAVRLELVSDDIKNSVSQKTKKTRDVSSKHLVYSRDSPDYCRVHQETGWSGTLGRECSKRLGVDVTDEEKASCHTLCKSCNHAVKSTLVTTQYNCNCTFQWCCDVTCQLCFNKHEGYYCS